tara:strand:+ start:170 stop:907 length:738 start_codon:yes stop_codon:yes gene_type:complete
MKFFLIAILSVAFLLPAYASEMPAPMIAEYFGCKLNEGKNLQDHGKWVKKWNKWMDSTDLNNYRAAVFTPLYRSPNDHLDIMWVGFTDSTQELARGQSAFRNSELPASNPAASCPFSFMASQLPIEAVNIQENFNPEEFVVGYWFCNIEPGKTLRDVHAVQTRRMLHAQSNGASFGSKIITPGSGTPAALRDYDFVISYASASMEEWGKNVDIFRTKVAGTHENSSAGTFECGNSTIWTGRMVRN